MFYTKKDIMRSVVSVFGTKAQKKKVMVIRWWKAHNEATLDYFVSEKDEKIGKLFLK